MNTASSVLPAAAPPHQPSTVHGAGAAHDTGVDDTALQDRLGRAIAARLSEGTAEQLPHEIHERLRAAREQALAVARREPAVSRPAPDARHGAEDRAPGWWSWLASAVPLLALVGGLVLIADRQADERAAEVAEVDAALLTDDLPTAAYTDPGFAQFLRANHVQR